jgi:DNA repair protein RecO (recombination protein O)
VPFAETSQVVHLATEEHGLVAALAKGARRPGPALRGGPSLLQCGEAELSRRAGAELEMLLRFRDEGRFAALGRDLERYLAACHVVELLRAWLRPALPNAPLLAAGLATLRALAAAPVASAPGWVVFFEARAVSAAGHRPRLDTCAVCDAPVARSAVFSPAAGGLAHRACAPTGAVALSAADREALVRLYTVRLPDLAAEPPSPREVRAVRGLHDVWLPFILERRPASLDALPRP